VQSHGNFTISAAKLTRHRAHREIVFAVFSVPPCEKF